MKNISLSSSRYLLPLITLGAIIFSLMGNISTIYSQDLQTPKPRFFCGRTRDNKPVTLSNTSTGRIIPIIIWEGRYSKDRCEFVSRRFEESYQKGTLKYLKVWHFNGYNVICSVGESDEECKDSKQILIYLAPEECPYEILRELTSGQSTAGGTLRLSSDLHGDPTTDAPEPEEINSN